MTEVRNCEDWGLTDFLLREGLGNDAGVAGLCEKYRSRESRGCGGP